MPSIISSGLQIKGDIISDDDVQIEGVVVGDVKSRTLTIGESGEITGEIIADQLQVSGSVAGQIKARSVTLHRSAKVEGDVLHETLSIESGAYIEGNIRRAAGKDLEQQNKAPQAGANVTPINNSDSGNASADKPAAGPVKAAGGK